MTVDALGLGSSMKPLRVGSKKEDGSIGRFPLFHQIEVGEQGLSRGVGFEREGAFPSGGFQKPLDTFTGQMMKRGLVTRRCVKGGHMERSFALKIVNKAGIDLCRQGTGFAHTATDELATGFLDQDFHFAGPLLLIGTPDVYEPGLPEFTCIVVLSLGGRDAVFVLITVIITEDSQVNVTALYLLKVNLIGPPIFSRKSLKKKNLRDESMKEGIT
jgi:hypothetical protein